MIMGVGSVAVYARLAYGQGDVSPVRPVQRTADQRTAGQSGTHFAARGQGDGQAQNLRAPANNVVDLPLTNKVAVEPTIRVRTPRPLIPVLAQQFAQEGLPDKSKGQLQRQKHEDVTDAYVLASDDAIKVLGPVRPRELVV